MNTAAPDFNQALDACRRLMRSAPRRMPLWMRSGYLKPTRPDWARVEGGRYDRFFREYWDTLRRGTAVWGYIVQANWQLFEPGEWDHPGYVAYSIDLDHQDVAEVATVAQAIGAIKGTRPERSAVRVVADAVTDELAWVYSLPVPQPIAPSKSYCMSVHMTYREHLPLRYLCRRLVPVLVDVDRPGVAMIVPSRYWSNEFVQWWVSPAFVREDSTG